MQGRGILPNKRHVGHFGQGRGHGIPTCRCAGLDGGRFSHADVPLLATEVNAKKVGGSMPPLSRADMDWLRSIGRE